MSLAHRCVIALVLLTGLSTVWVFPVAADIAIVEESEPDELGCNFLLTDQGEALGDATPVVVAATSLQAFGTVKIRVFDETPDGDLDAALADLARQCEWLDDDGNYPPDLFVFGVSIGDRATRVLYGSDWEPALDDSASVIVDRVVNSQFSEGNFQGGLIGGIEQFVSLRAGADNASAPTSDVADESGVVDDVEDAVEEVAETTPETVPSDAVEPEETLPSSEVAASQPVEEQGSKTGTYLLIAGVLGAIVVLPALFLKRSGTSDVSE